MTRRRKRDHLLPLGVYRHGKKWRLRIYIGLKKLPAWHVFKADTETAMRKEHMRYLKRKQVTRMGDVFDRYLAEEVPKKARATQRSDKTALDHLRLFFADTRPNDIRPAMIVSYVDTRARHAPVRANREAALLSHVFTKCLHWGLLEVNPSHKLRYRNPEAPRTRYVTDRELWRAMRLAPAQIRYVMALCVMTGLRRADLLGLTWGDFGDQGLTVELSKSRRKGAIPKRLLFLWETQMWKLCMRVARMSRIIVSEVPPDTSFFGISERAFEHAWGEFQKRVQASGIERFQMKDLRAKYGTDLAERGGDATKNLAHSSRSTTQRHYQRRPIKITL